MTGSSPPYLYALSVRQPWAWLIVHGFKPFENRDWSHSYGPCHRVRHQAPFRCLIHAAKGMTSGDYEACQIVVDAENAEREMQDIAPIVLPPFAELPRGGIVGAVDILSWHDEPPEVPFAFGSGLGLANPELLPFTKCKGALGFFIPNRATMPGFAEGHAPHFTA